MSQCELYNPDKVFQRFKVIEFPTSFIGLSFSLELYIEVDLNTSAYLKTMHEGDLLKFEDAREISAAHRAFSLTQIDNHVINITFKPSNECISKAKREKQFTNRFVFDLRLIQVDGSRCCNKEFHSEIGRYYISGQFEYCNITHYPKIMKFGDVTMNSKVTKCVRICNESNFIAAKMQYIRVTGFEVKPQSFLIPPNSSKRITISIKPTSLKIGNVLVFTIKNPHDINDETVNSDKNYLSYTISCELKIVYAKKPKISVIESLHKLKEQNLNYTYMDKELTAFTEKKKIAFKFLEISKASYAKKPIIEKFSTGKDKCYFDCMSLNAERTPGDFCKKLHENVTTYDLLDILFIPFSIEFGRVGLHTYGEHKLTVKNNTKYDIVINLFYDECILYTEKKLKKFTIILKSTTETNLTIFCLGFIEGSYKGTFEYSIDNKYYRKHPYSLQVGNPTVLIKEKCLKFGMVTTESFVTSAPVRMYNYFNITVNFKWCELLADTPFEIIPRSGSVPKHGVKICDVIYICKPTKTKTHEVEFMSQSMTTKVVPIELSIMTRKLSIKFLQSAVLFKDIALNLETVERVKLENSSREIALFHVVEPLIPGLTVNPMYGTIRPKMIMTFEIIVKISCVLEFAFDVYVKINNKENVILPVSGNVVEPKITIHPKNIYMARIPCHMISYVPVTFLNGSTLRTIVEVLDTGDENIFDVYVAQGNEKQKVYEFIVEGGQTKTVFIKVYDIFRREYEMYLPFKINGLLGPPNQNSKSIELQHYIGEYEQYYENNTKVKLKTINKDISFCRMTGVITVPWIHFSVDEFEIDYIPNGRNIIEFTMTNISKYHLFVTILTSKLSPNFSLDLCTENNQSIINETNIKFELEHAGQATFTLKFHPRGHGRFVSVALLFLDKHMTIPYYNLTFIGKRQTPIMTPSTYRIIFPPTHVGVEITRTITLKLETESNMSSFCCGSKEEPSLNVKFIGLEIIEGLQKNEYYSILIVRIAVCCQSTCTRNIMLTFHHESGSGCDIEISFCFTYCQLTLHNNSFVELEDNPYPYFPLSSQKDLYEYMETCLTFLEKWMFQQGFRRDLYPVIPDTFHAISSSISSQSSAGKTKGINVSYLNFVRRIAGPLMKHIRKISVTDVDESFKCVKEIHDTYREIIALLRSRGADLWVLQAKFLLSYDQFIIYTENVTPKCNADILLTQELLNDINQFSRLNMQSWFDFILQSYKVFVLDSCFFECVCVSSQPRDIIKVIVDWYNEQIMLQHRYLRKDKQIKIVKNITTDLSDGIALISTILNYCPFLKEQFSIFSEVNEETKEEAIINNACLIIEAMNQLRLYFPLCSKDFLQPNFLQMLFLSIHFYVTLPMFKPKDTIVFAPPLLRTSTRQVAICPMSQESLIFTYMVLNNTRNSFIVEKGPTCDNGKKIFLNIKYVANFVNEETSLLLVHGYNKTRIFDTYIVFLLQGYIGALNPVRKCKVTGPLYRPNKVDVLVSAPFTVNALYDIYITDTEPTIPVEFEENKKPNFFIRRLNLIDKQIHLSGIPKESGQDVQDHKLYLQMYCLSTQIGNTWIWFRSGIGEFFIRVTTQPRWDLAIDTLQAKVHTWPMDPCSCGEACECYRTTILTIPHRNELMVKSLRYALLEHASEIMMNIFDQLIETTTGKIILGMLLCEGGTNMSDVQHILRSESKFRITSKALIPRLDYVTLSQHTGAILTLPVTVPAHDNFEKYSVTFTSECGMDIRTYKVLFIEAIGHCESISNIN